MVPTSARLFLYCVANNSVLICMQIVFANIKRIYLTALIGLTILRTMEKSKELSEDLRKKARFTQAGKIS